MFSYFYCNFKLYVNIGYKFYITIVITSIRKTLRFISSYELCKIHTNWLEDLV